MLGKYINLLHYIVSSKLYFKICIIFFRPSENVYLKRIDYINKFRENFYLSSATINIPLLFILAVLEEKKKNLLFRNNGPHS